jgi:hypothetical protein
MDDESDNFECAVCMIIAEEGETPRELTETSTHTPPNTLLWSACHIHAICKGCLVQMATSFGQAHPIGPQHPMIRCPYPFEDCLFEDGQPNYFAHTAIERLLTDEDKEHYISHASRYQFPGYELVSCPRPIANGGKCGAGILVPISSIQSAQPGRLVMFCDQTAQCQRRSCYHCHGLIQRGIDQCDVCLAAIENTNPTALNHYFYKPNKVGGDGQSALLRNEEITVELAIEQILDVINSDKLESRCFECLTILQKTEQCNTLEHCGIERCYSCGRSGTHNQKLGDHWDSMGASGCPRFDHSVFWNVIGDCKFRCTEGTCYNDELGDCTVSEHASGVRAMIDARKAAHVYHALKSLLAPIRSAVVKGLCLRSPTARQWLPRYYSSDYRTYLPEPIMRMQQKTRSIVDNITEAEVQGIDAPTWEFTRDFAAKTANIVFNEADPIPEIQTAAIKVVTTQPRQPRHKVLFNQFKSKYGKLKSPTSL